MRTEPPRFSVIVPVHDEAALIGRTAAALLDGLPPAQLVFVCNGCTDASAAILRRLAGDAAQVIELADPGKARALAHGERLVDAFPRFFVDSDVLIPGSALARLADRLGPDGLELVSPRIVMDLAGASWAARQVNAMWLALPHGRSAAFHHVLGLSAAGRARWGVLPDVIADDAFIEAAIPPAAKAVAADIRVISFPPRTFSSFVRVRARWLRGTRELRRLGVTPPSAPRQMRALAAAMLRPRTVTAATLYVAARLLAELVYLAEGGGHRPWTRDHSSRQPNDETTGPRLARDR